MPTHSSLASTFVVITRTWTNAWLFASAGRTALTGVTFVAAFASVASAT